MSTPSRRPQSFPSRATWKPSSKTPYSTAGKNHKGFGWCNENSIIDSFEMSPHLIWLGWHLRSILRPASGSGLDVQVHVSTQNIKRRLILKLSMRCSRGNLQNPCFSFSCFPAALCPRRSRTPATTARGGPFPPTYHQSFFSAKPNSQFHTAIQKNCMVVGKKVDFIWQEITKGWGYWGMAKTFFIFLSFKAAGLVVPRESTNFVSFCQLSFRRVKIFCPSGVLTHPLRTKIFHSPKGQLAFGLLNANRLTRNCQSKVW